MMWWMILVKDGGATMETGNGNGNNTSFRTMRALVTGGAGFIGSHLVDALIARGATVAVIDNFATGRQHNVPDTAQLLHVDLQDGAAVHDAVRNFQPSHIFHQAAQASVKVSVD